MILFPLKKKQPVADNRILYYTLKKKKINFKRLKKIQTGKSFLFDYKRKKNCDYTKAYV